MKKVEFIDRQSGEKVVEQVPGGGMMRFLYGQNIIGRFLLWAIIKRRILSVVVGWYMVSALSGKSVAGFVKKHGIDLSDYKVPEKGFKHFNRFFYRELKDGARPIGTGIVSPADGKAVVFEDIDATQAFYIKGEKFNLEEFLQDKELANNYNEGAMVVVRLAPTDYHRFHFPITGYVGENRNIGGSYYSVSPLALKKNLQIFCQNKRDYTTIDSDELDQIIVSEVGATLTGSIVQSHWPNIDVKKGESKGFFAFGGSTVIVLFKKDKIAFSEDLLKNTKNGFETTVKMGESIGNVIK